MSIFSSIASVYPAGIEFVWCNQTQSVSNVQRYYRAGDVPAKENNQMNKKLVLTVLILLSTLTLAACAPRVTTKTLSPEKGAAYAAEVDDIVENYIVGFSENDYAKATRDCHEDWKEFWDESRFHQDYADVIGVLGAYESKTLDRVEDRGWRRVVIYHLVFENNPDVILEVYFNTIFDPRIVGSEYIFE